MTLFFLLIVKLICRERKLGVLIMKSSNIFLCLFAITLCTSICIAETYTTTKTYYQPTRTVTKTVIDETTNPMYSVNRNDKIQAVQPQQSTPKVVTTTTTTEPTSAYKTVTTTVQSPATVTNKVIDATKNPVYAIPRNDKIQAALDKQPVTVTTTSTVVNPETVKTTVVEETKNTIDSAKEKVETKVQETTSDLTKEVQNELAYYESLKTCTMGSMNNPKLSLRTYGVNNGLCNFDMAMENPKTGRMVTMCTFNVPMEATKKYAEEKLRYAKSLIGLEKLSTSEHTALTNSLATFTQQYCK